jgi:hypothetical protein
MVNQILGLQPRPKTPPPRNENSIQLLLTDHKIDPAQFVGLAPPAGVVVIEMLPEAERVGALFLPDCVKGNMRPDVGIVLAVGPDITLPPGSIVAVRPYDGQWINGFEMGGYRTENQVRFIGTYSPAVGELELLRWDETIPLQLLGEDLDMVATGRNLIIQREPLVRTDGSFELPFSAQYWSGMATIKSIGPECWDRHVRKPIDLGDETRIGDIEIGDRIHYNAEGILDFLFAEEPNLAIIPDIAVNLLVRSEA